MKINQDHMGVFWLPEFPNNTRNGNLRFEKNLSWIELFVDFDSKELQGKNLDNNDKDYEVIFGTSEEREIDSTI